MNEEDNFWWLPESVDWRDLTVEMGHHEPLYEDDPRHLTKWTWETGRAGDLLPKWRRDYRNTNVYRKLEAILSAEEAFIGPIVLDIDCEQVTYGKNDRIVEIRNNLNAAQRVAVSVWQRLEAAGIDGHDFRVYFSGRNGFHFEIRPLAIGCHGTLQEQINAAGFWERDFVDDVPSVEPCHIDRAFLPMLRTCNLRNAHSSVRLADSLNCWFDLTDRLVCRRKSQVSQTALLSLPVDELCRRAEQGLKPDDRSC